MCDTWMDDIPSAIDSRDQVTDLKNFKRVGVRYKPNGPKNKIKFILKHLMHRESAYCGEFPFRKYADLM